MPDAPAAMKTCTRCAVERPVETYKADRLVCRQCINGMRRKSYAENEHVRAANAEKNAKRWSTTDERDAHNARRRKAQTSRISQLKRRFGLTVAQFDAIWASQGSKCPVCFRNDEALQLHVDHDHACCPSLPTCGGCVRGILCRECNIALGFLKDSTESLNRAITYLSQNGSNK